MSFTRCIERCAGQGKCDPDNKECLCECHKKTDIYTLVSELMKTHNGVSAGSDLTQVAVPEMLNLWHSFPAVASCIKAQEQQIEEWRETLEKVPCECTTNNLLLKPRVCYRCRALSKYPKKP